MVVGLIAAIPARMPLPLFTARAVLIGTAVVVAAFVNSVVGMVVRCLVASPARMPLPLCTANVALVGTVVAVAAFANTCTSIATTIAVVPAAAAVGGNTTMAWLHLWRHRHRRRRRLRLRRARAAAAIPCLRREATIWRKPAGPVFAK